MFAVEFKPCCIRIHHICKKFHSSELFVCDKVIIIGIHSGVKFRCTPDLSVVKHSGRNPYEMYCRQI